MPFRKSGECSRCGASLVGRGNRTPYCVTCSSEVESENHKRYMDRKRSIETYVVRDSEGSVIYVGRTDQFNERMANHLHKKSPWLAEMASIERQQHPTYGHSLLVEAQLIFEYQPKFNITGVTA